jgi:hypothetical protein
LHKANGSNSCERSAGGAAEARAWLSAPLGAPSARGEQRCTVRRHTEGLLKEACDPRRLVFRIYDMRVGICGRFPADQQSPEATGFAES